jgi:hypothetical protein
MVESQICFLVSKLEAERKTDWEEMKAAIQSIRSERDETQVENIMMCVIHKTQSLQKAYQETTTCHKATKAVQRRFSPIQE